MAQYSLFVLKVLLNTSQPAILNCLRYHHEIFMVVRYGQNLRRV